MKQTRTRSSAPADRTLSRPFVHRPSDVVRAGIGLAVLLISGGLVHGHKLAAAESSVLLFVNGQPDWLYRPMWVIQFAGVIVVGPIAAAVAAVLRQYRLAAGLLLATGLKIWLESVVKIVVQRQRPGVLERDVILRGNVAHVGLSFVSGHAILVFAMAALISPYLQGWWKTVPWALAGLNLLARLYLGAHFPLDLIGGAGLGLFIGAGLNFAIGVPAVRPVAVVSATPSGRSAVGS
jgi:undecaprenyl-diphosphatase